MNPRALSCGPAVSVPGHHTRREPRRRGPHQNGRAQRCVDRAEMVSSSQPRPCLPPDTGPTRREERLLQQHTAERHIDDDQTRDAPFPIPRLASILATSHLTTSDTPPQSPHPNPGVQPAGSKTGPHVRDVHMAAAADTLMVELPWQRLAPDTPHAVLAGMG